MKRAGSKSEDVTRSSPKAMKLVGTGPYFSARMFRRRPVRWRSYRRLSMLSKCRSSPLSLSAVQIGTALQCPEAKVAHLYREALKNTTDTQTTLTNIFTGRPAEAS